MASEASVPLDARVPASKTRVKRGSTFFFVMSLFLLAFVLVGFAPTLYLRSFLPVPSIPPYLYLHGAILTAWFVWLAAQTSLVRSGRTSTHRKMGVVGGVIALGVAFVGPMAAMGLVSRIRAGGVPWDTDMSLVLGPTMKGVRLMDFISGVVWGDLISIVAFALLVSAALLLRKYAQAHKRLMLFASIAIITPALARISRLPHMGGENGPLVAIVFCALVLTVVAHDLYTRRRLHPSTMTGCGVLAAGVASQHFISASEWGQQVVRMMA